MDARAQITLIPFDVLPDGTECYRSECATIIYRRYIDGKYSTWVMIKSLKRVSIPYKPIIPKIILERGREAAIRKGEKRKLLVSLEFTGKMKALRETLCKCVSSDLFGEIEESLIDVHMARSTPEHPAIFNSDIIVPGVDLSGVKFDWMNGDEMIYSGAVIDGQDVKLCRFHTDSHDRKRGYAWKVYTDHQTSYAAGDLLSKFIDIHMSKPFQ